MVLELFPTANLRNLHVLCLMIMMQGIQLLQMLAVETCQMSADAWASSSKKMIVLAIVWDIEPI